MNLVRQIMEQLSGDALGKLNSQLGSEAEQTERAAQAAVPSLLAAVAGMAKNNVGARKLTDVLGGLSTDNVGNLDQMFSGDVTSLLGKGTGALGSLFGDSMVSSIADAVSRFAGLDSSTAKKLLGYLAPLVLGKVAAAWKSQGGTASALQNLMADERQNIADAAPAGFAVENITRLADDIQSSTRSAGRRAEKAAAGSAASWILPLAVVLIGGYLLWQFLWPRGEEQAPMAQPGEQAAEQEAVTVMRPELPEGTGEQAGTEEMAVTEVRENVNGLFESLNSSFAEIEESGTAQDALPELRDLEIRIDSMSRTISQLPEQSRQTLRPVIEEQARIVSEKAEAIRSIEGIGTQAEAVLQQIEEKIRSWLPAQATQTEAPGSAQ